MITRWAASRQKRVGDILLAGIGGLAISPVLLLCAAAVRLCDGPGVIFRQTRVGRGGNPFTILKFRTMRTGETGRSLTSAGDPRVTPIGRVLRRFKLDELPQLWNVVRGDMSLVGPRPELPVYVDQHPAAFRRLGKLRPGITDWASLTFRDEEALLAQHTDDSNYYTDMVLPGKLALARLYRRHASACLDFRLVLATVLASCRLESLMHIFAGPAVRRAWCGLASIPRPQSSRDRSPGANDRSA